MNKTTIKFVAITIKQAVVAIDAILQAKTEDIRTIILQSARTVSGNHKTGIFSTKAAYAAWAKDWKIQLMTHYGMESAQANTQWSGSKYRWNGVGFNPEKAVDQAASEKAEALRQVKYEADAKINTPHSADMLAAAYTANDFTLCDKMIAQARKDFKASK
tara:strand:- start:785 stop:1264 length:480 start_codon:yes stop_codon:yes gene_type:complete